MLKLKLQYFGHLMWRADSLEKTLMLGKIEGRRRRGRQRMRCLDGITVSMDMSLSRIWWWTGRPGVLQFMGSQRVRHDWATELNGWAISAKTSQIIRKWHDIFKAIKGKIYNQEYSIIFLKSLEMFLCVKHPGKDSFSSFFIFSVESITIGLSNRLYLKVKV